MERRIGAARIHQVDVRPSLHQSTLVEHQHLVAGFGSGEAMGDRERGPSGDQALDGPP